MILAFAVFVAGLLFAAGLRNSVLIHPATGCFETNGNSGVCLLLAIAVVVMGVVVQFVI